MAPSEMVKDTDLREELCMRHPVTTFYCMQACMAAKVWKTFQLRFNEGESEFYKHDFHCVFQLDLLVSTRLFCISSITNVPCAWFQLFSPLLCCASKWDTKRLHLSQRPAPCCTAQNNHCLTQFDEATLVTKTFFCSRYFEEVQTFLS